MTIEENYKKQIEIARKYLLFIAEHPCTREKGCLACEAGLGLLEMDQIQSEPDEK